MTLAHLLRTAPPARRRDIADDLVFTIDGILSPEEALALISAADDLGFEPAPITVGPGRFRMAPHIRDNTRVMVDDFGLAAAIWERLRPWVHPEAIGVNERFRVYRYERGQAFRWHLDGSFRRPGEASRHSVLIYLNDDFEGGRTEIEGCGSVEPRTGRALLFDHRIEHQGAPVSAGTKYVLRTDLMFRG